MKIKMPVRQVHRQLSEATNKWVVLLRLQGGGMVKVQDLTATAAKKMCAKYATYRKPTKAAKGQYMVTEKAAITVDV